MKSGEPSQTSSSQRQTPLMGHGAPALSGEHAMKNVEEG